MERMGVPRIVCMSNVGAGGSGYWWFNGFIIPVFARWLIPLVDDKDRMERILQESSAEWIAVRLVGITTGPAKPIRCSTDGRGLGMMITAASVAEFLLDRTEGSAFLRETPSISN